MSATPIYITRTVETEHQHNKQPKVTSKVRRDPDEAAAADLFTTSAKITMFMKCVYTYEVYFTQETSSISLVNYSSFRADGTGPPRCLRQMGVHIKHTTLTLGALVPSTLNPQ